MTLLLTGATGYIGGAVLRSLVSNGHDVTAVVRSARAASTIVGARAVVGDVTNVEWFSEQLRAADGAIHAAAPGSGAAEFDSAIADAVIAAFEGTTKPYVHTGGIWAYGNNLDITEESPRTATPLVAWRAGVEARLLSADVATTVIEPAVVYGEGRGLLELVGSGPRIDGALQFVGSGQQHWATVHVDDLAALYRLVIERGSGLGYVIGSNGERTTVEATGRAFAGASGVVASSVEATRERLGATFADALLLDQAASGAKARSLGWHPTAPSALDELLARA